MSLGLPGLEPSPGTGRRDGECGPARPGPAPLRFPSATVGGAAGEAPVSPERPRGRGVGWGLRAEAAALPPALPGAVRRLDGDGGLMLLCLCVAVPRPPALRSLR